MCCLDPELNTVLQALSPVLQDPTRDPQHQELNDVLREIDDTQRRDQDKFSGEVGYTERRKSREFPGGELAESMQQMMSDRGPWSDHSPLREQLESTRARSQALAERARALVARVYGEAGVKEEDRRRLANRFALVVMAGVAAETVVTGFDIVSTECADK